jgi:dienelactone hydrolase
MMIQVVPATSQDETVAFFPGGPEKLLGILTRPTVDPLGTAVVLIPTGAGTRDSINRNRLWVRLARKVAGLGYHAVRFDYHGAGESTGIEDRLRLDRPVLDDLVGAVDWATSEGVSNFILVGSCYGARAALSYAPRSPGLQGVVLATPPLLDMAQGERAGTFMAIEWTFGQYLRQAMSRKVLRGLLDRERRRAYAVVAKTKARDVGSRLRGARSAERVTPNFLRPLEHVIVKGVPVLFLYGERDDAYEEFEQARSGQLGRHLERAGAQVEVAVLPGKIHAFSTVRAQEIVMDRIADWLVRLPTTTGTGR